MDILSAEDGLGLGGGAAASADFPGFPLGVYYLIVLEVSLEHVNWVVFEVLDVPGQAFGGFFLR